jgi:hypothetical protein
MGTLEDFGAVIQAVYEVLNIRFELFGFELSFWMIFVWSIVASLLIWFIGRLFE